jgi:hypothetical protein
MTILLGLRSITSGCARCRALATRRIVGAILDAARAEAARDEAKTR